MTGMSSFRHNFARTKKIGASPVINTLLFLSNNKLSSDENLKEESKLGSNKEVLCRNPSLMINSLF